MEKPGFVFRQAWISGVIKHYPGVPKPGYVVPWDETPEWERQAAAAVERQIREFVVLSGRQTGKLSREQKGRFVAICWIAQIHKHFDAPKASYVADWEQLPRWQQETDADIFEAVERE